MGGQTVHVYSGIAVKPAEKFVVNDADVSCGCHVFVLTNNMKE